jgi:hypothetical protein
MSENKTELVFERETKRMLRYQDPREGGFGTIYVPKSIFSEGKWPEKLTLTLNWA